MKERPILMSAPMVKAILAGTKSQTRRVVKGMALKWLTMYDFTPEFTADPDNHLCPYGIHGDRLWVREAWGYRCSSGTPLAGQFCHTIQYRADDARKIFDPMPMDGIGLPKWVERTDGQDWESWDATMTRYWRQWRPSIHMPRWARRILLEVTDVRVERLQSISEADALAEGIERHDVLTEAAAPAGFHAYTYRRVWEQINGPGSWDANPFVWCVSFKRLDSEGEQQ